MKKVITYQRPDIETACDFAIKIGEYMQSAFVNQGTRSLIKDILQGSHVPFYRNSVSVRVVYRNENGRGPCMYVEIEGSDLSQLPKAIDRTGELIGVKIDDADEVYQSIERIGRHTLLRELRDD